MRIFLDSYDLINLLEEKSDHSFADVEKALSIGEHILVLNYVNILEIAAPLIEDRSRKSIWKMLHHLDKLPHEFIALGNLFSNELQSAYNAYINHEEYEPINPYVKRLDEAMMSFGMPAPTRMLLNMDIHKTVSLLLDDAPEVFGTNPSYYLNYKKGIGEDRATRKWPSPRENFCSTIRNHLRVTGVQRPFDVNDFANWIYTDYTRCPSIRLSFEVFGRIRKNVSDKLSSSDSGDMSHVLCLPYVDKITLDARMRTYVSQAARLWTSYQRRVSSNLTEVLKEL